MPLDSQNDHPLAHIQIGAMNKTNGRPIPLLSTDIDVKIRSGIAIVKTERVFINKEKVSIEATLTFPIPVHATMMSLEAKIDDRLLKGVAKRKVIARETYETALDAGKTAILHEEVLRGLHMLSVGHVAPGKEVKVICTWAMPLVRANLSGDALLRIPTTIGDIYGMPPMLDSAAPTHDAYIHKAHIKVTSDSGVSLIGGGLINNETDVALDSPIDIRVVGVTWGTAMQANSKSGKTITLRIAPGRGSDEKIDSVVLVDRSSSMGNPATKVRNQEGYGFNKHQVFIRGLTQGSSKIQKEDTISLWEFDETCGFIGKAKGAKAVSALIPRLGDPRSTTELESALQKIIGQNECQDILIATDGKTYSIDVQKMAQTGRRFHVILIGDDSLDANVGSLAAMTGGELFPVSGANSDDAILLAMEALRRPELKKPVYVKGLPKSLESFIGGMVVNAEWDNKPLKGVEDDFSNAIVAIATSMALAGMETEKASELAEQEGIVCHLTSLVLVDEEAVVQEGIPEQRKVHLSTPSTQSRLTPASSMHLMSANACAPQGALRAMSAGVMFRGFSKGMSSGQIASSGYDSADMAETSYSSVFGINSDSIPDSGSSSPLPSDLTAKSILKLRNGLPMGGHDTAKLTSFVGKLSWDQHINAWLKGDLSNLPVSLRTVVEALAGKSEVIKLAHDIGKQTTVVVLAILAQIDSSKNVGAQRFARSVLGKADKAQIDALIKTLS